MISFPGPVILLEGKANMLKQRAALSDDPIFRALVVLDFRAGSFLVGLDAQYKFGDGGELIEIGGSAEAFFDFNDASRWHLYLGRKDPRERRIRSQILGLFEANSYFMIDATQLQTGAWVGYDKRWSFGPLSVVIEAWIEGGVSVSWKPVYFHGELWLHGKVELRVFGFGPGLHADALFAADVFDPFHVLASLSVGINLPWPLPDFDVEVTLEWGPTPEEPPLPLPLKEIAVEHFKSTASWPLPRTDLLLPNVDAGEGYLALPPPAADLLAPPPSHAPMVPMDARPHITFGRAVHDDALVGVNPQPVLPGASPAGWERIGDPESNEGPMRVRFAVKEVALSRWDGASWVDEARKAASTNPAGVKELYGSWAPMPQLPSGSVAPGSDPPTAQVKLWLWSKSPFDFSTHGGRAWDEWFTDTFTSYPCIPPAPERTICCDFDDIPPGTTVTLPMPCRRNPEVVFVGSVEGTVHTLPSPVHGHTRALCWRSGGGGTSTSVAYLPATRGGAFGIVLTGEPANRMTLVFAGETERLERRCLDLHLIEDEVVKFPLDRDGITVRIFDSDGKPAEGKVLQLMDGRRGFDIEWSAEVELPCAAERVDIALWQGASPARVAGLDARGDVVAKAEAPAEGGVVTVTLEGEGITRVLIEAPQDETFLLELCATCRTSTSAPDVHVVAVDADGQHSGPHTPVGDTVTMEVERLRGVQVYARGEACLVEVCATFPPSAAEVAAREDMAKRLTDSMALWGNEGEVLQPGSDYRIAVVTSVEAVGEGALAGVSHTHDITEAAYFQTGGPPALATLSTPVHHPPEEPFDSGLDDLTRYVRQTVPPTVPASGAQPSLPRPVYRAYDVGVKFNEDYVDLMYRLAKRDLGLYLYDANNQPVRDAAGRLIVSPNRWGVTESVSLTESTVRYLSVIDQATCASTDPEIIPHQVTVFSVDPGQVLDPDIVYDARLVPLLLHEDFRDGLGAWTVVDGGANQGPSAWAALGHATLEGSGAVAAGPVVTLTGAGDLSDLDPATDVVILATDVARASKSYRIVSVDAPAREVTVDGSPVLSSGASAWEVPGWGAVVQSSNIWGGDDTALGVPKPGTMLVGGGASWTDLRYSVQARSRDNDAIGVVFRYRDASNYYRFSMDRERQYRRLVRVVGGAFTVLAEDDFVYSTDQDYLLTVEAIGTSLRVYQDGELVFDAVDASHPDGRVGLYCWASEGARFSDVRVDDFQPGAPVAYRFSFTTSDFADLFHHLHSFQDETWVTEALDGALAAEVAAAVTPSTAPSDAETRAYDRLAAKVLGAAAQTEVEALEVHRITSGGDAVALLLRSPEPIDWARTSLTVSRADGLAEAGTAPGAVKVTDTAPGGATPNDETITLLLRERMSAGGLAVETYGIPGPLEDAHPAVLLDGTFERAAGVLFEERFGDSALDGYRIVDAPGAVSGPSQWSVTAGEIIQTANIYAGAIFGTSPARPGTVAVTGSVWSDIRLTARLRSDDNDAIGVVFRYQDDENWYRFSMDRERSYRRLARCVAGTVTTLWEDAATYDQSRTYEVGIDASGDLLMGYLDHQLLFVVRDDGVREGQVGFYAWANVGARFLGLRVESLEESPLLLEAPFEDVAELEIVDSGTTSAPSHWTAAAGTVRQDSNIWGGPLLAGIERPGTVALLASAYTDLQFSVKLSATDNDALGVVFRYQEADNWYRFSMDRERSYRRLVRCVGGVHSVLWQDTVPYDTHHEYRLTVRAEGTRLRGWLDGTPLFDVTNTALRSGRIGLYTWANAGAQFSELVVTDPVRRIGPWRVVDETFASAPSAWGARNGVLRQTANIGGAALPDARGTLALGGQAGWDDYRITARLRSDDDDAIGLVLRYVDLDNWYRLSLDSQRSYRRFVKCEAGVLSTLWEDSGAHSVGQPFTLTIDAIGDRMVARHDEEVLFDLHDGAHASGRAGLYAWANTGARFERITVTRPPLDAYAIFRDRFDAGDTASWTIVDSGTVSGPSNWAITSGELRQTSNIHSMPVDAGAIEKAGTHAVAGDATWDDIVFTARVRADDNDAVGLLFRYVDEGNYYRFSMDRERSYRRLIRRVAGVSTTLWEDGVAFETGRAYDFTVAALGARLTIWLDGVPLLEVEDATHASGRIGLYCWANEDARFSNIRVFRPDRLHDASLATEDFDFETPGLWSVATAGDQSAPASWTVSGGELHQTSNVWGGSLDGAELAKPGTVALLTQPEGIGGDGLVPGSASWTDYRLTVRLRSTDNDAIGAVFRWEDEDNWYRFSMDRERSYRRLVKCVGGAVTELWADTGVYALGREYLLTLDAVGDTLVGYLDGVELFSVRDGSLATGTVGLYCWGNTGAHFSSVRVTEAAWSTQYGFHRRDEVLAAGTRIAIRSGNEVSWVEPLVPGLVHRFLAEAPDQGRTRLPAGRALDVRLRDAVGRIVHARRFLPDEAYAPLPAARLLRKADGTEAAIVIPSGGPTGSTLPDGAYRLRFTYRRDNTASDPESTVLSRAGDQSDEVVTLDVPWAVGP
ncbi:MAG: hypothetical protein GEU80_07175 [Dehalococcoidia bacterium]|nr:hypothetical protein [Dehalococcoidia bacterium]